MIRSRLVAAARRSRAQVRTVVAKRVHIQLATRDRGGSLKHQYGEDHDWYTPPGSRGLRPPLPDAVIQEFTEHCIAALKSRTPTRIIRRETLCGGEERSRWVRRPKVRAGGSGEAIIVDSPMNDCGAAKRATPMGVGGGATLRIADPAQRAGPALEQHPSPWLGQPLVPSPIGDYAPLAAGRWPPIYDAPGALRASPPPPSGWYRLIVPVSRLGRANSSTSRAPREDEHSHICRDREQTPATTHSRPGCPAAPRWCGGPATPPAPTGAGRSPPRKFACRTPPPARADRGTDGGGCARSVRMWAAARRRRKAVGAGAGRASRAPRRSTLALVARGRQPGAPIRRYSVKQVLNCAPRVRHPGSRPLDLLVVAVCTLEDQRLP